MLLSPHHSLWHGAGTGEKDNSKIPIKAVKQPFQQMDRGNPSRSTNALLAKQPFRLTPLQAVYSFCQKPRHFKCDCQKRNELCLVCGFEDHLRNDLRRTRNTAPIPPALPAPSMVRNPGPTSRKAPLPPNNMHLVRPRKAKELELMAEGAMSSIWPQKKPRYQTK